ncbi:MAG: Imm50 family immunity protein [Planctomycetota bacterium]
MNIPGSELLTSVFGYWPSFHDAEVVRLELVRVAPFAEGPDLLADIHAFEITRDVGPDGYLVLRHHVLVSFRFGGVDQLRLEGWNNQNVLFALRIEDIRSRQLDVLKFEVRFDSSFGVGADFLCRSVEIQDVRPWELRGQIGQQGPPRAL